jgi:hypothetical protein
MKRRQTMKLHNRIIDVLEKHGFLVHEVETKGDNFYVEIAQYTPQDEDWWETIWFDGTNRDFIKAVEERYVNFDVDEETEKWIEARGKNGVPDSIRLLLEDAEWKQNTLAYLIADLLTLYSDREKRVKQISLDVLVDENTDGDQLAEEIKNFLEVNGYNILGAALAEDLTDRYAKEYGLEV